MRPATVYRVADPMDMIFVFGSNLRGIHGAGAAHYAAKAHGYPANLGSGLYKTAYGIPTKDWSLRTLLIGTVTLYICQFLTFAEAWDARFRVTRIGCGLAGYRDEQIAPIFAKLGPPPNCYFDTAWEPYLGKGARYWGTYEV